MVCSNQRANLLFGGFVINCSLHNRIDCYIVNEITLQFVAVLVEVSTRLLLIIGIIFLLTTGRINLDLIDILLAIVVEKNALQRSAAVKSGANVAGETNFLASKKETLIVRIVLL